MPSLFESVAGENPLPIPVAPYEMGEYRKMSLRQRESISSKFFDNPDIKDYQDRKWRVELHNRDCYLWLKDLEKTETDPARQHAIQVKIEQFERAIINNPYPFTALALDMTGQDRQRNIKERVDWDE